MPDLTNTPARTGRSLGLACALLGLVTLLVYIPCLSNDFVDYDDARNFRDNLEYRGLGLTELRWMFTTFHLGPYQPLSWMTLGLDYLIWGMNPRGYHLTNALIHAAAAGLFAAVAFHLYRRRTNADDDPPHAGVLAFALLAGVIWALHPLRVEAVAWATERREVLCGALTLLTLLCHLTGKRWYVTAACALLALLAKATAVVLPVMLVMIDLYLDRPARAIDIVRALARACFRHAHLIVLAGLFSAIAVVGQFEGQAVSDMSQMSILDRLCLYVRGLGFYAWKTLVPMCLGPLYEISADRTGLRREALYAALFLALVITAVAVVTFERWLIRRRLHFALPLFLTYLAMIAPVGGLVQVGTQLAADRYAYQPGWALSLIAALGLTALLQWLRAGRVIHAAVITAFGMALAFPTIRQQRIWRDPEALWSHQVACYPETAIAHYNLGLFIVNHYGTREADLRAEPHFRAAIALRQGYVDAFRALGNVLKRTGRYDEALICYEQGLQIEPDKTAVVYESARLLWIMGRYDDALERFARLGVIDPATADTHVIYARALAAAGRMDEARAAYERAMDVEPAAPTAPMELAWLLATHPVARYRNGEQALMLARHATKLAEAILARGGKMQTSDIRGRLARTTAAALAEQGDYAAAMRLVEDAQSAKLPGLGNAEDLLLRFRQSLPMREPPRPP